MGFRKKERLYLKTLLEDPLICYPPYYQLSGALIGDEILHDAIRALHSMTFDYYQVPESFEGLFASLQQGGYAIYKEKYIVGYFGQKLMYLQMHGWKALPANEEIFRLENWLA